MAEYLPPTENLPIFDSESFKDSNNEFLTYDKANKYFLKFPNAQGTENFNTLSANEITATGDLLLNPVGSVDMNGKVLNMTNGEIHNCPLIHSKNNQDIVIEGKGTGKVILKTNNSDSVRIFTDKSIFYKPLHMNFDTNIISYKIFIQNTGVGAQTTLLQTEDLRFKIENNNNGGVIDLITSASTFPFAKTTVLELSSSQITSRTNIVMDSSSNHLRLYEIRFVNLTAGGALGYLFNSNLNLRLENSSNNGSINLVTNDALGNQTTGFELTSASATIRRPILMTDASSNNRVINSSTLQLNETTGGYSPTVLHQIYQTDGTANYINLVNSGTTNISVVNAVSTLVTPLQITSTSLNIPSNINLAMAAGTGFINQPTVSNDVLTANIFKKSTFVMNNSAAGSHTVLDAYCSASGRGIVIFPNAIGGANNPITQLNDTLISGRFPSNGSALTLTVPATPAVGVRIAATSSTQTNLFLRAGSNIITMDSLLATNINHNLNFSSTAPLNRQLRNLGTTTFLDVLGNGTGNGTTLGTIEMNSSATVPGLNFDCSLNSGNHNFTVNNSSGIKINPFSVGSEIRHNVPTIMSDFTVPLNLSYAGGLLTGSVDDTSISSAIGTRELTNFLIVSKGTYIVNANFRFSSLINDAIVDRLICGVGNVSAAFNAGGQFSTGIFRNDSLFTIQNPGTERRISTTVLSISSSNTTIYFNYLLEFTAVSTLMSIGLTYSITRIA